MRVTYIYQKDSTLMAFEGPEKCHECDNIEHKVYPLCEGCQIEFDKSMSTARESALPVVNVEILPNQVRAVTDKYDVLVADDLKPGEPVALPGWGLEKELQYHYESGWDWIRQSTADKVEDKSMLRQAYRLKRSEPDCTPGAVCNVYGSNLMSGVEPSESQEEIDTVQQLIDMIRMTGWDGRFAHNAKTINNIFTITRR